MAAPTAITVEVDREEYSRFESDRDTVLVTLDVKGTNLLNEQITVQLFKARRGRDESVVTKTVTLTDTIDQLVTLTLSLPDIIDSNETPLVRRGKYFVRATSVTSLSITDDTSDFIVSLITVSRLKKDYLHGTDQFASDQLMAVEQPTLITGATVEDVSLGHPKAAFPLSYNFKNDHVPTITSTNTETFAMTNGQTLVLRIDGGAAQTATFNTADFANISLATAAEVAAVINTDITGVTASDATGQVKIDAANSSIVVDDTGTANTVLGFTGQSDTATVVRTLSWCGGPQNVLTLGKKTYVLTGSGRAGALAQDYIKVRVSSIAALPQESHAEKIVIDRRPLDDVRMREIIDQAISWVEDIELSVYLEPTRLVTEVDAASISFTAGDTTPQFTGANWDKIVDGLLYTVPASGHWINFKMPYYPVIEFEELYGKLSSTRIVDIALEWIEHHGATGWVELVPFNQESLFNFIGLVWVESIRGPVPLPNFWQFKAMVGFKKTPRILLELVAKKAAMDILVIAGQAFRGGFASQSISRDGVSESVSYTASATFGIYSATTSAMEKDIKAILAKVRGAYRGVNMVVM